MTDLDAYVLARTGIRGNAALPRHKPDAHEGNAHGPAGVMRRVLEDDQKDAAAGGRVRHSPESRSAAIGSSWSCARESAQRRHGELAAMGKFPSRLP